MRIPIAVAAALLTLPTAAHAASLQAFPVPTGSADLEALAAAPDGTLWFTEHHAGKLGHVALDGSITEVKVPNGTSLDDDDDIGPTAIVKDAGGTSMDFLTDIGETVGLVGLDGTIQHLYGNGGNNNAQSLSPARGGGAWEVFFLSDGATARRFNAAGQYADYGTDSENGLLPMATGPDGTMFYGDGGTALRSFTEAGAPASYPLPQSLAADDVTSLAFDGSGTLHFTSYQGASSFEVPDKAGSIGTLGPDGVVSATSLGGDYLPRSMVLGPDGAMWWAEKNGIGRLDPSGAVQHGSLGPYNPTAIAFGGDGNLWFVDNSANAVGRVMLDGTLFPAAAVPAPGPAPAPVGPTPLPVLKRAPAPKLTLSRQTIARVRAAKALRVTVSLPTAGTVSLQATLPTAVAKRIGLRAGGTVTVATGSHRFTKAGKATVRLKLTSRARRALARSRHALAVTVSATSSAPGATASVVARRITLKR